MSPEGAWAKRLSEMAQGCSEANEEGGEGCRAAGEAMCGGDAFTRAGEVIRVVCGGADGVSEGVRAELQHDGEGVGERRGSHQDGYDDEAGDHRVGRLRGVGAERDWGVVLKCIA